MHFRCPSSSSCPRRKRTLRRKSRTPIESTSRSRLSQSCPCSSQLVQKASDPSPWGQKSRSSSSNLVGNEVCSQVTMSLWAESHEISTSPWSLRREMCDCVSILRLGDIKVVDLERWFSPFCFSETMKVPEACFAAGKANEEQSCEVEKRLRIKQVYSEELTTQTFLSSFLPSPEFRRSPSSDLFIWLWVHTNIHRPHLPFWTLRFAPKIQTKKK